MDETRPDTCLTKHPLGMVRIPARPARPRESGLTVAADRGLGPQAQSDLIAMAGTFIDRAKLAMGLARLLPEPVLREKIGHYAREGIPDFLAGEVSELAILQGVAGDYYRAIADLGAWGVEVSNAQITLDLPTKMSLIATARRAGLEVVAEVGSKGGANWATSAARTRADVAACLEAGAERVLIQAEGLNEGVAEINAAMIEDLVAAFGLKPLIFQAKTSELLVFFLSRFGAAVNLDVDSDQVLELEACRRGIRKRGLFAMMASTTTEEE